MYQTQRRSPAFCTNYFQNGMSILHPNTRKHTAMDSDPVATSNRLSFQCWDNVNCSKLDF